ncbi:MAG: hypothetical protein AAFW70_29145 [Cyanobacteria bacterium J06635_10]
MFPYRLDTNFAKIDRIIHPEIEDFKQKIVEMNIHDMSIRQWTKLLSSKNAENIKRIFKEKLSIVDANAEDIIL